MSRVVACVICGDPETARSVLSAMGRPLLTKARGSLDGAVTSLGDGWCAGVASVSGASASEGDKIIVVEPEDPRLLRVQGVIYEIEGRRVENARQEANRVGRECWSRGRERPFRDANGEFAVIAVDPRARRISVVRDRFGTQMLFGTAGPFGALVAPEIKCLLATGYARRSPNWSQVYRYLYDNYRYSYTGPDTFFDGIAVLPPDSVIALDASGVAAVPTSRSFGSEVRLDDLEASQELRRLLAASYELRRAQLPSDPAFFLSGGLDSPSVASIASGSSPTPLHAFSICYFDEQTPEGELRYDESAKIREIVRRLSIDWTPVSPGPEQFERTFVEMLARHDEPISSPTWYSHWILCREVAEAGFKYAFGGDGGDHALAGLYDDVPYYLADLEREGPRSLLESELDAWERLHDHPVFRKNRAVWDTYRSKCFDLERPGVIVGYSWDESRMRGLGGYEEAVHPRLQRYARPLPLYPAVSRRYLISKLWQDLLFTSSPASARAEDINLATFGVGLRSIYLDADVMQFCWSLPGNLMIRNGMMKFLMREAFRDSLPTLVVSDPKHVGLNSPANLWFRGPLRSFIEEAIEWTGWRRHEIAAPAVLRRLLDEHLAGAQDHMMFLWKVASLRHWLDGIGLR